MNKSNIIGIVLAILIVGYVFYLRFTNIDMTDTRLLLTFWKQFVFMIPVMVYSTYLMTK